MIHIFVLNSYPTAGKDTFVDAIAARHNGIYKLSSVDLVKEVAKKAGWDGTKTPKNREFLSNLKDLLTNWDDIPYKDIAKKIELIAFAEQSREEPVLIFVMVREPIEIQKFVDRLDAKTIFIERDCLNDVPQSNHADSEVEKFHYDYYIKNNEDIDSFVDVAEQFYQIIREEDVNGTLY